jgi:hypothetical protein
MAEQNVSDLRKWFYSTNGYAITEKTMTYAAGAGTGNVGTVALFTVTGRVMMKIFAFCTADITTDGAATVSVGTALSTAGLIASTTATAIDANEIWHDATPDSSIELSSVSTEKIVSQSIINTIATANMTGGTIVYVVHWRPVTQGASVVAA